MACKIEACADCAKNCVILHGKNKNTAPHVHSFITVMISSQFSELLYIPPKFAPTISGLLNQNIRLEDSGGRQWEVTLSKVDGSFAFQRGWNAFSRDHGLEVGYFLLFDYLGSHFRVDIYDRTGCRKVDFPENRTSKKRSRSSRNSSDDPTSEKSSSESAPVDIEMKNNKTCAGGNPYTVDGTGPSSVGAVLSQLCQDEAGLADKDPILDSVNNGTCEETDQNIKKLEKSGNSEGIDKREILLNNCTNEVLLDEDNDCEVKRPRDIKQEQGEMTPGHWSSTKMANVEIDEKKPIVKAEHTASDGQLAEGEAINGMAYSELSSSQFLYKDPITSLESLLPPCAGGNPYTVDGSERSVERSDEEDQEGGGPSTRLRKRTAKPTKERKADKPQGKKQANNGKKNVKAGPTVKRPVGRNEARMEKFEEAEYRCDLEGGTMSFGSKQELTLHKKNACPVKGCDKKFLSHKYLVQHRRVHLDDRPLKCPWKGCKMTFKWPWAKTEHIRVHTGARPYICAEPGCGQTFRFVSNFSRHKRKTGHSVKGKG